MNLELLKYLSFVIVLLIAFIFTNIPILISYLLKFKYKNIGGDNVRRRTYTSQNDCNKNVRVKPCCTSKFNQDNSELQVIDINDDDHNDSGSENEEINLKLNRYRNFIINYNLVSTYLTCFSGGIFLATSVLELLPDVVNNMNEIKSKFILQDKSMMSMSMQHSSEINMFVMNHNNNINSTSSNANSIRLNRFPLGEFFIIFGILIIMALEQLIIKFNEKSSSRIHKIKRANNDEHVLLMETSLNQVNNAENTTNNGNNDNSSQYTSKYPVLVNKLTTIKTRTFVLLIALCIHSIFEGLSIGLQTNIGVLGNILIAISIHKCLIAFSFGQQLVENLNKYEKILFKQQEENNIVGDESSSSHKSAIFRLNYKFLIVANSFFSFSNPFGIFIGSLLINYLNSNSDKFYVILIINFLKAISCGTFIYITFFEIIANELNNFVGNRLVKIFFLFFGYFVLSFILFI